MRSIFALLSYLCIGALLGVPPSRASFPVGLEDRIGYHQNQSRSSLCSCHSTISLGDGDDKRDPSACSDRSLTSDHRMRAIVSLKPDSKGTVSSQRLDLAVAILKQHGATEIIPIQGTAQLVVTASETAFAALRKSGIVQSIQPDLLSPTN